MQAIQVLSFWCHLVEQSSVKLAGANLQFRSTAHSSVKSSLRERQQHGADNEGSADTNLQPVVITVKHTRLETGSC